MKTLYLLRHAKSSWAIPGQKDYDRPLNERGMHDAPEVGRRMLAQGVTIDKVVSSPAQRAISTAVAVCVELGIDPATIVQDRQIYLAGSPKLQQVVSFLDEDSQCAIIVAHNPALTDLANDLARAGIDNIPTAGLVGIELPVEFWAQVVPGIGKLISFDYPKSSD